MNTHRMRRHLHREPPHRVEEADAMGDIVAVYLMRGEWPNLEPRFPELTWPEDVTARRSLVR
jgi:hypothetical protein